MQIEQAVRVRRDAAFKLSVGARAEIICWGVMPSGMLRHSLFVRRVDDHRDHAGADASRSFATLTKQAPT